MSARPRPPFDIVLAAGQNIIAVPDGDDRWLSIGEVWQPGHVERLTRVLDNYERLRDALGFYYVMHGLKAGICDCACCEQALAVLAETE